MTCNEFASIVRDYARLEWLNNTVREQASDHVAACRLCRERLQLELAYESQRSSLVAQRASLQAPDHVEAKLMAAFRARAAGRPPVLPFWKRPWFLIPATAALALMAVLWPDRISAPPAPGPAVKAGLSAVVEPPDGQSADPAGAVEPGAPVGAAVASSLESAPVRRARRAFGGVPAALSPARAATARENAPRALERTTDFVPLRYGKPVEPGEMLQVVRIELGRRELLRMGVPIPPDSSLSAVKADVILGEDGMAKAIRLVY